MFIKDKKDIHNVLNQNYIFQIVYLHFIYLQKMFAYEL